jgi:plastocyanin
METLFYGFGIALILFAFAVGLLGPRMKEFPAGPLFGVVIAVFVILVACTATFAVGFSNDEQSKRDEEKNVAQAEKNAASETGQPEAPNSDSPAEVVKGPGGTVKLTASATDLAFNTTTLTSKPGKVTIDLTNPSTIPHNIAIEDGSKILDESDTVASSDTSASASLAPGTYTFLCTVPGHAEAGMQGTLTIK